MTNLDVKQTVKQYYGEELQTSKDLKTNACCTPDSMPTHIKKVMSLITDEVITKYYGCGSPIPLELEGLRVLDIGSGTGRDAFIMSKLVGSRGFVSGIDMTKEQVAVAQRNVAEHMQRFGFTIPNVQFILDYVENTNKHFQPATVDLVTSNCVINLVKDKAACLKQIFTILKDGGEFFFADIYADRRLPEHLKDDPVLYGECLGGALYEKDFERLAREAGFADPRIVSKRVITIENKEVEKLVGPITFYSTTYRLWKVQGLEGRCEDFGHVAIYQGTIPESPNALKLDSGHVFPKGKPELVCGNTALMIQKTRFAKHFKVVGDFSTHLGDFKDCGSSDTKDDSGGCC